MGILEDRSIIINELKRWKFLKLRETGEDLCL